MFKRHPVVVLQKTAVEDYFKTHRRTTEKVSSTFSEVILNEESEASTNGAVKDKTEVILQSVKSVASTWQSDDFYRNKKPFTADLVVKVKEEKGDEDGITYELVGHFPDRLNENQELRSVICEGTKNGNHGSNKPFVTPSTSPNDILLESQNWFQNQLKVFPNSSSIQSVDRPKKVASSSTKNLGGPGKDHVKESSCLKQENEPDITHELVRSLPDHSLGGDGKLSPSVKCESIRDENYCLDMPDILHNNTPDISVRDLSTIDDNALEGSVSSSQTQSKVFLNLNCVVVVNRVTFKDLPVRSVDRLEDVQSRKDAGRRNKFRNGSNAKSTSKNRESGKCPERSYPKSKLRRQASEKETDCKKSSAVNKGSTRREVSSSSRRPYECNKCGVNFKSQRILKGHSKMDNMKEPFQCNQCLAKFRSKLNLNTLKVNCNGGSTEQSPCPTKPKHESGARLKKPNGGKPFKCNHCSKIYACKSHLKYHLQKHSDERPFKCGRCPARFKDKRGLSQHLETHNSEKLYECKECGRKFKTKSTLTGHVKVHSSDGKSHQCNQCDKTFSRSVLLNRHLKRHGGEKLHQCDQCLKRFKFIYYLHMHQKTHTEARPFKCDQCARTFKTNTSLILHLRLHSSEKPYKCDQCSAAFKVKSGLRQHLETHSNDRPYKCNQCPGAFKTNSHLSHHLRSHSNEKPYKCDQCLVAFKTKALLRLHLVTHSNDRPYKCDQCPAAFKTRTGLMQHVETHRTERLYKCNECGADFKTRLTLKRHFLTHSNEASYHCSQCSKRFKTSSVLKSHLKTHIDRLFECDQCPAAFKVKVHLRWHLKSHSREGQYKCDQCPAAFKDRHNLRQHLGTHSNEKPYECNECGGNFKTKPILSGHLRLHCSGKGLRECGQFGEKFKRS